MSHFRTQELQMTTAVKSMMLWRSTIYRNCSALFFLFSLKNKDFSLKFHAIYICVCQIEIGSAIILLVCFYIEMFIHFIKSY